MSATIHEVPCSVRVVRSSAEFYEGEQIAVDDFNPDRWTGKVMLRFVTPHGHFDRTVKASAHVFQGRTEEAFKAMEKQMLGHLRRHGIVLDRIDWKRSDA